jgi:hypothetical protein
VWQPDVPERSVLVGVQHHETGPAPSSLFTFKDSKTERLWVDMASDVQSEMVCQTQERPCLTIAVAESMYEND